MNCRHRLLQPRSTFSIINIFLLNKVPKCSSEWFSDWVPCILLQTRPCSTDHRLRMKWTKIQRFSKQRKYWNLNTRCKKAKPKLRLPKTRPSTSFSWIGEQEPGLGHCSNLPQIDSCQCTRVRRYLSIQEDGKMTIKISHQVLNRLVCIRQAISPGVWLRTTDKCGLLCPWSL